MNTIISCILSEPLSLEGEDKAASKEIRGWLFLIVLIMAAIGMGIMSVLLVYIGIEEYFIHIQDHLHLNLTIIFLILFVTVETVLTFDCIISTHMNFVTLYVCCVTMNYWLQQIWLNSIYYPVSHFSQ